MEVNSYLYISHKEPETINPPSAPFVVRAKDFSSRPKQCLTDTEILRILLAGDLWPTQFFSVPSCRFLALKIAAAVLNNV